MVMIVAFAVVLLLVIRRESVTEDELIYIPVGLSYLQRHDARMNIEHPPLEKVFAAVPLMIEGARPSYGDNSWAQLSAMDERTFGEVSLRDWGTSGARRIYLARLPMIALTLALALSVFWIARSMSGAAGGFLSLAMLVGSPFYLAYGPLVLTDVGVALFCLLAVWTFARLWERPDLTRSIAFGSALGGAFLSKFSSGLLLPVLGILGAWYGFARTPETPDVKRAAKLSLVGIIIAGAIVYGVYAGLFWNTDVTALVAYRAEHATSPKPAMAAAASLFRLHPWIERLSYPAVLYVWGASNILHGLVRPGYLLGKVYPKGTLRFFPTVFVYKMTIGFLLLAALVFLLWIWRHLVRRGNENLGNMPKPGVVAVAVLFVVFSAAALTSSLNLGIRYISVPIVALTVLLSLIVPWSSNLVSARARTIVTVLVVAAVAQSLAATAIAFPEYLPYFNALNRSRPNYQVAIGSDLDWGQSLIELRDLIRTRQIGSIKIDVRGSIPAMYLPEVEEFECENGLPKGTDFVAIGASRFITTTGLRVDADRPLPRCGYLFDYPHWVNQSGSLYLFQVNSRQASFVGTTPRR